MQPPMSDEEFEKLVDAHTDYHKRWMACAARNRNRFAGVLRGGRNPTLEEIEEERDLKATYERLHQDYMNASYGRWLKTNHPDVLPEELR